MHITLSVKDASDMNAYVAMPAGDGKFPAVMVFQEAFGVNGHIRSVADRLAAQGYIAVAPELFHRSVPAGTEFDYNDFSKIMPIFQTITPETLLDDVQATYSWLQAQPNVHHDKIGCIGFCLGGRVAFLANSAMPIQAAVSFYGGSTHTNADRAGSLSAPMLFFWGGKDQHIKPEHVQTVISAVKEAQKPFINVEISYADHGFFNEERAAYHPEAAKESWGMTLEFFNNKLK